MSQPIEITLTPILVEVEPMESIEVQVFSEPTPPVIVATDPMLAAHTQASDPHPQYATDSALTAAVATLNQAIVTKENSGTASSALAEHTSASDPHPQYATDSALAAAVATLNQAIVTKENSGTASSALAEHTSATNPHPQYLVQTELESALAAARGYWEFRQTTKPTARPSGSLATGDRWLDTTDHRWWFWNGSYWLSEQIDRVWVGPALNANATPAMPISSQYNIFVLDVRIAGIFASPQDVSNYWEFGLERVADGSLNVALIGALLTTASFNFASASQSRKATLEINQFLDVQALNVGSFRVAVRRIGLAGTGANMNYLVRFRHAR